MEPAAGLGLAVDCMAVALDVPVFAASVARCANAGIARFLLAGDSSAAVSRGPLKAVQLVLILAGNGAAVKGVAALWT